MTAAGPTATKRCPCCGETKSLELFARDRKRCDGRVKGFKACKSAEDRARYQADPEKTLRAIRAWRDANLDKARAADRARQAEYRKKKREADRIAAAD